MTNSPPEFRERDDDEFISHPEHPEHGEWLEQKEAEERKRDEAGDDALQDALDKLAELSAPTNLETILFEGKHENITAKK